MAINEATMDRAKTLLESHPCKCGVCLANVYLQLRIADQIAEDAAVNSKASAEGRE